MCGCVGGCGAPPSDNPTAPYAQVVAAADRLRTRLAIEAVATALAAAGGAEEEAPMTAEALREELVQALVDSRRSQPPAVKHYLYMLYNV